MASPVYVHMPTRNHQPYLGRPSAAEVVVTLLFESRAAGEIALHAFSIVNDAAYVVISPHEMSAAAWVAEWQARSGPLLQALLNVDSSIWQPESTCDLLSSSGAALAAARMVEVAPVQAGLSGNPAAYRYCSAHPRFQSDLDPLD